MAVNNSFKYLEMRPGDSIRQPFVKGRNIWAEVLYRDTVGEDPRTPEEVAGDYEVPLGAVLEAIDYCVRNEAYLRELRAEDDAWFREFEKKYPLVLPSDYQPES